MRRRLLEKILPLPFVDDWRTRADDCLVFGASLAGARKYYLAQPLVAYRVHDGNHLCGRTPDRFAVYRRRVAINRLFEHLERTLSYNVARLADFHHREFRTIGRPTFRELAQYLRISMAARMPLVRRFGCMAEMARHFLRTRVKRAPDAPHLPQAPPKSEEVPLLRLSDAPRAAADTGEAERAAQRRRAA
jgi:hypothetical protein